MLLSSPSEITLLPITKSPGVNPCRRRQNISLPDKPVMRVIINPAWSGLSAYSIRFPFDLVSSRYPKKRTLWRDGHSIDRLKGFPGKT